MTRDGWRVLVLMAVDKNAADDPSALDLLVELLHEQDAAKQALRDKGYGWTGLGWAGTVQLIPRADA